MILNMYFPVILEIFKYLKQQLERLSDNHGRKYKTKCTSELQYIKLYSGPEFQIHFRYALVMNYMLTYSNL